MTKIRAHIFRTFALVLLLFSWTPASNLVLGQQLTFNSGGGPLTLLVQSATAGSEPLDETDNSTEIFWDAHFGVTSKITVGTIVPGQSFHLYVLLNVPSQGGGGQGIAQPEVELNDGMLDTDLFTDIPFTLPGRQGFGTLIYRGAASVAEGNSTVHGDDVHIVTYTILAQ